MAYIYFGELVERGAQIRSSFLMSCTIVRRGVVAILNEHLTKKRCIILVSVPSVYYLLRTIKRTDYRYYAFSTRFGNWLYGNILDIFSSPIMSDLRQRIKGINIPQHRNQLPGHSHPDAANLRAHANLIMEHAVTLLGLRAYHYQLSPSQQRLQLAGYRSIYCAKDLQMRVQGDKLKSTDVIVLTDVDYYLDMPSLIAGNPILMYSFVPEEVAGQTEDGVYCTHTDNTVEVTTSGGSKYRHPLWDYDDDHIMVDYWTCSYVYLIEQLRISNTRRIIFLNPIRKIHGPIGWILPGRRFKRREFNVNGVVYSKFTKTVDKTTEVWHSLAKAGEHIPCTVKSEAFLSAFIRLTENKDPHLSDVERYFNTYKVDNSLYASSLFYHVFKTNPTVFDYKPKPITPCGALDNHTYQCVDGLVSEDGQPTMRSIWPGYASAFSPAKSYNNDKACLKGRIEDVKNQRPQIPPVYYTFMAEFVDHIVPPNVRHSLSPLAYENMWEQFDRANQRSLLAQADYNMDPNVFVKSFQKREAYPKVCAPRNISTLPMAHNAVLGQYTIPLLQHVMKKCHWYAFGKHPKEFSSILHSKARGKLYATSSDFNKLDGSIRGIFRDLFIAIATAAFHPKYHDELIKVEAKERTAKCHTTFGIKYIADSTVLSGSSMTSLLGTLVNAFCMYVAYRYLHSPVVAWDNLGVYGGDDGVSFDLPPEYVMKVTGKFGLLCEAELSPAGTPIKFLGRVYLDIWTSDQSMADVQRQMRKLHLTASPKNVPDWMVLYRKAIGYRVTDPNTPLLTEWCDAVIRIVTPQCPEEQKLWNLTKVDSIYWSKFESPFNAPTDKQYASGYIADTLGLSVTEMYVIARKFRMATRLEQLYMQDIFRMETKITVDAVYKGETRQAPSSKDIQKQVRNNAKIKLPQLCRFTRRHQPCPYPNCKFSHVEAQKVQAVRGALKAVRKGPPRK